MSYFLQSRWSNISIGLVMGTKLTTIFWNLEFHAKFVLLLTPLLFESHNFLQYETKIGFIAWPHQFVELALQAHSKQKLVVNLQAMDLRSNLCKNLRFSGGLSKFSFDQTK